MPFTHRVLRGDRHEPTAQTPAECQQLGALSKDTLGILLVAGGAALFGTLSYIARQAAADGHGGTALRRLARLASRRWHAA